MDSPSWNASTLVRGALIGPAETRIGLFWASQSIACQRPQNLPSPNIRLSRTRPTWSCTQYLGIPASSEVSASEAFLSSLVKPQLPLLPQTGYARSGYSSPATHARGGSLLSCAPLQRGQSGPANTPIQGRKAHMLEVIGAFLLSGASMHCLSPLPVTTERKRG